MKNFKTLTTLACSFLVLSCSIQKGSEKNKRTPSSLQTESPQLITHKNIFVQRALADTNVFGPEVLIHLTLALSQANSGKEIAVSQEDKKEFRRAFCGMGLSIGEAPEWSKSQNNANCYFYVNDIGLLKGLFSLASSLVDDSRSGFQFDPVRGGSSSGLGLLVFEKDPELMKSFTGSRKELVVPKLPSDANLRMDLIRAQVSEEIRSLLPRLWISAWRKATQSEPFAENINTWLKPYLNYFERAKQPVVLQMKNSVEDLLTPMYRFSRSTQDDLTRIQKEPRNAVEWFSEMNSQVAQLLNKKVEYSAKDLEKKYNTDETFQFFSRESLQSQFFEGNLALNIEPKFFLTLMEVANLVRILDSDYQKTYYYVISGLFEFQRKTDFVTLTMSQKNDFALVHFEILNLKLESLVSQIAEFHSATEFSYVNEVQSLVDSLNVLNSDFQRRLKDRLISDSKGNVAHSQLILRTSELAAAQTMATKRIDLLRRDQKEFQEELVARLKRLQADLQQEFSATQEKIDDVQTAVARVQESLTGVVSEKIDEVKSSIEKGTRESNEKLEKVQKSIGEGISQKIDRVSADMNRGMAEQSAAIALALENVRRESFDLIARAEERIKENEIAYENAEYVRRINETRSESQRLSSELWQSQNEILERCFPLNESLQKPEFEGCLSEIFARIQVQGLAVDSPERSVAFDQISIDALRPVSRNLGYWGLFQSRYMREGAADSKAGKPKPGVQMAQFKTLPNSEAFYSSARMLVNLMKSYPNWSFDRVDVVTNLISTNAKKFEAYNMGLLGNGDFNRAPVFKAISELKDKEKIFQEEVNQVYAKNPELSFGEVLKKLPKSERKILGNSMGVITSFRAYAEAHSLALLWIRLTLPNVAVVDPIISIFLRDEYQVGTPEWVKAMDSRMRIPKLRDSSFENHSVLRQRIMELLPDAVVAEQHLAEWIPLKSEVRVMEVALGEFAKKKEIRQKAAARLQTTGRKFLANPKNISPPGV